MTAEEAKLEADLKKSELDCKKTTLEIRDLQRWYFIRPHVLQPMAAIVLAFGTAGYGYLNGWIDTRLQALKNEEFSLEASKKGLNTQVLNLATERDNLKTARDGLQQRLADISAKADQKDSELARLKTVEKPQMEHAITVARAEVERLRKQLQDVSQQAKAAASIVIIHGIVESTDGTPIVDASVTELLQRPRASNGYGLDGPFARGDTHHTDATGYFSFSAGAGSRKIAFLIEKEGYKTVRFPANSQQAGGSQPGILPEAANADLGIIRMERNVPPR